MRVLLYWICNFIPMRKFFTLQLIVIFTCAGFLNVSAQDSVKKTSAAKSYVKPATPKYLAPTYPGYQPAKPGIHTINKLVQDVRWRYYRTKTDAEVAAIMYGDKTTYYQILDREYADYDAKKGISRAAFNYSINRKYGDPFPTAKPVQTTPLVAAKPALKPPVQPAGKTPDTIKAAVIAKPDTPGDKSLSGQYRYLLTKVYNYQQPLLGAYHKNVMDSLNQARNALKIAKDTVAQQHKTIDSLQAAAKATGQTLSESNSRHDEISLLGIPMTKSTYNLIMWGLVILFAAIAAIVVTRSGVNSREAKYRTQLYNELDEEYKNYKIKANEKEIKLARELQTERNKLDDMLGK